MFLGQGIFLQQLIRETGDGRTSSSAPPVRGSDGELATPLRSYTDKLKQTFCMLAANSDSETEDQGEARMSNPAPKRKRDYEPFVPAKRTPAATGEDLCALDPLPKEIEDVLEAYFKFVHPWVPVLHPSTFTRRARDPERSDGVTMILSAVVAVAAKYVRRPNTENMRDLSEYASACRQNVVTAATESNSIESVQALLLIAFDTVCLALGRRSCVWTS